MPQPPVMSVEDLEAFLEREFPQIHFGGRTYHVEAVGPLTARMRMDYHERHIRPGGTLSGPAMMTLADLALYIAILAQIGPVALAVTTNLSFNFLRKPAQKGADRRVPAPEARQAARGRGGLHEVARGGRHRLPGHRDLLDPGSRG
jgi:acyl-coenzyme A thioesterase PaaI-like protein